MDKKVGIFLTVLVVILAAMLACVLLFLPDLLRGDSPSILDTSLDRQSDAEQITAPLINDEPEPDTISDSEENLETEPDMSLELPQIDPTLRWYEQYSIVAHAMGCIEGRTETNSKEAFLASYALGQRVFEVDLSLTSDDRLVARHDFDQISYYNAEQRVGESIVMDYETFMAQKIKFKYTPLDIDGVLQLLSEHPDTYLITDTKETGYGSVSTQFTLLNEAVERIDPSLRERIIVQIYNDRMFDRVKELFPCENWIFTLYQIEEEKRNYDKIASFCKEKEIEVVTISAETFCADALHLLHENGLRVYYHTVNRILTMLDFRGYGADGFYSDYVTQSDLEGALQATQYQ